jgi:predicted DNA-binding transcriptional regulator YafY
MLTPDEIEAIVLGAQWVSERPDRVLANAARDVLAKVASAVPKRLLPFIIEPSVGAKPREQAWDNEIDLTALRTAIRDGKKVRLSYRSETGEETVRTTWPVILGYAEATCMLVAWCELRENFRHFRTDRILEMVVMNEPYGMEKRELRRRWQEWRAAERARQGAP